MTTKIIVRISTIEDLRDGADVESRLCENPPSDAIGRGIRINS
jgi:hypothetical protein